MAVEIIEGERVTKGVEAEARKGLWLGATDLARRSSATLSLKGEGIRKEDNILQ